MEITKVVKPFIRRGANTFGNVVYVLYSLFIGRFWGRSQHISATSERRGGGKKFAVFQNPTFKYVFLFLKCLLDEFECM